MFAFPKSIRLKHRLEFKATLSSGRKVVTNEMVVLAHRRDADQESRSLASSARVGFIVSKKVSRSAVRRNLVKRRLREAFRLMYPRLNGQEILAGHDVVVIARHYANNSTAGDIGRAMGHCFDRLQRKNTKQTNTKDIPAVHEDNGTTIPERSGHVH